MRGSEGIVQAQQYMRESNDSTAQISEVAKWREMEEFIQAMYIMSVWGRGCDGLMESADKLTAASTTEMGIWPRQWGGQSGVGRAGRLSNTEVTEKSRYTGLVRRNEGN